MTHLKVKKPLLLTCQRSSGIEALFQDVNALQKWLLQSGFISGGIATEKNADYK